MSKEGDIILTLVNDKTSYDHIFPVVKEHLAQQDENTYKRMRQRVYESIRKVYDRAWSSSDRTKTTHIVLGIVQHYAEEALGRMLFDGEMYQIIGGWPEWVQADLQYKAHPHAVPAPSITPTQENTMTETKNIPAIETRTFIFGNDARNVSDDDIVANIANIENNIRGLEKIETKPAKLVQKIDSMRDDIKKLAAFMDARE